MKLINVDELYYEDVECTDGNTYSVIHAPEIDNADVFDLSEHDKQVRAEAIEEVIALARAEIDFESQAEQKRFIEFMEDLKEQSE